MPPSGILTPWAGAASTMSMTAPKAAAVMRRGRFEAAIGDISLLENAYGARSMDRPSQ